MTAIVTTRTARKRRACSRCGLDILPGERYASSSLPPGGEMGNITWWRNVSHVGAYLPEGQPAAKADHDRLGIACDEAAAYREAERRLLVALHLLAQEALNG